MYCLYAITKPAHETCANIRRPLYKQFLWFSYLLYSATGIKHMRICDNFQPIISSTEETNEKHAAHDTEANDFSTLYTNFVHAYLIDIINWCLTVWTGIQNNKSSYLTTSSYHKFIFT